MRTTAPAGSPDRANDNFVLVEGVVQMAAQFSNVETAQIPDTGRAVRRSCSREQRQDSQGFLDFSCEEVAMKSVVQPPSLLLPDVSLRCRGEANAAWTQDDRSSLRSSVASTRRPAATSASESRNAACSAARSASSSQSPGSSGRRSISVPSGRSVGSSTRRRPACTRALRVTSETLPPDGVPNKPLERSGGRATGSPDLRGRRASRWAAAKVSIWQQ